MIRLVAACLLTSVAAQAQTPPNPAPGPAPAPAVAPAPEWVPKGTADLILLDKIRAQPTPLVLKVGDQANFGSMTLHLTACFARPPDQPADSAAFLEIANARSGDKPIFRGWILANTPSVSQVEDPIYDVRLARCR